MIETVVFVSLVVGTLILVGIFVRYTEMRYDGYPKNPLRWAQERRRQDNKARARRISTLEHELGYRPCSDSECGVCTNLVKYGPSSKGRGHPIWDHPFLPDPKGLTELTVSAYNGSIAASKPATFSRGTSSGGPR